MAEDATTSVTAVTRIYTGGTGAPWQPGTPVSLPASHAEVMKDAGHASTAAPEQDAAPEPAAPHE